jgi:similar to spore coat protein
MATQGLAIHEMLEIHEMLSSKTVSLTEAKTRQHIVQDTQLKTIIQQEIQQGSQAIKDLQGLLSSVKIQ